MKYVLLVVIIIAQLNFAIACDPSGSRVLPGESEEDTLEREKLEHKISLNYYHNQVRNDSKYSESISDLIVIARIEKVVRETEFMKKVKSFFVDDYNYENDYIDNIKLRVSPSASSDNESMGDIVIKLKLDRGNSCGSSYITTFKDKEGNNQSKILYGGKFDVGAENVFFLRDGKLVYSIEKSVFIDSNVKLSKKHENLIR